MTGRLSAVMAGAMFCAALFGWGGAKAQDTQRKAVLELFTSQGCSSCPPADALLGKYAERDNVIALSFNVDYWDYLGWKDTLATPANTARQRAYARARGDGRVYTPQVVVNGIRHAVGSQKQAIEKAIASSREALAHLPVKLKMWTEGDTLIISTGPAPQGATVRPATIWLVLVKKSKSVEIQRGENRGRTITYHHVVQDLSPVGRWTGQEVTVKLPKQHLQNSENDGCVAFLQQDIAGPILAAAEMRRW